MRDVQPAIEALLREGYSVPQIMRRMHVTKAQVQKVAEKMKQLRNVG
jgi:hypothetical protein